MPKHITCASSKKKFLEQNCIGIASIICILAWIIFVSFFSKPDRVTFLKRQLYWAEKSWKSRFLGQQPFLCIKVTIISEFLGCGAFTLWQEPHYIYQVWFVRGSYYVSDPKNVRFDPDLIICCYRLSHWWTKVTGVLLDFSGTVSEVNNLAVLASTILCLKVWSQIKIAITKLIVRKKLYNSIYFIMHPVCSTEYITSWKLDGRTLLKPFLTVKGKKVHSCSE